MTKVFLIRHGAYQDSGKVYNGRKPGLSLSNVGRDQAKKLSERLKATRIVAVYASPLERTLETAQEIARFQNLEVVTDERLLEIRSPLEGSVFTEKERGEIDGNFYQEKFIKQGGETLRQVFDRMNDFILEKVRDHEGQKFVAVSHGDPIMSVNSMYLDDRLPNHYSFSGDYVGLANGYILTFESGKFKCLAPIFEAKLTP